MRASILVIALCACGGGRRQVAGGGCGFERWAVKTASDEDASAIATRPAAASIAALSSLPAHFDAGARVAPLEVTTWQLTDVALLQYRRESDGDYHLVLGDGRRTLIAEIPDPACVAKQSPLRASMVRAREQFDARHGPVPDLPQAVLETVTVTGVGFYDSPHEQAGAAPDEVELHPVLSICFGPLCAGPPPQMPPSPSGCTSVGGDASLALLLLLCGRRAARARRRA